jgi:hypothetical protein
LAISTSVLLLGLLVLLLVVVFPAGANTPAGAVLDKVKPPADKGSARVLAEQKWGGGGFVLVRFTRHGRRFLRLAFVSHATRGWRAAGYAEKRAELDDVVVGSLMVSSSGGSKGQPAWSAVAGELGDSRIARVEVKWSSGAALATQRRNDAYLVIEPGVVRPLSARYTTREGVEIATVPVSGR